MNDRHRRVERLKQQQFNQSLNKIGMTTEQAAKLCRDITLALREALIITNEVFKVLAERMVQ